MNFQSTYKNIILKLDACQGLPLLAIRLIIGIIFIQTGLGKLIHFTDTTAFFADLHIPMPALNAAMACATEFVGGILLILGLETRLISIALAFVMVIAIVTAQLGQIHGLSEFIRLQEVDYLLFFGLFVFTGAGKFSIDYWVRRKRWGV